MHITNAAAFYPHRVAAAADRLAFLGQRRLLGDIVRIRVEILDALCHHHALGILPRTLADAFARVDSGVRRRVTVDEQRRRMA